MYFTVMDKSRILWIAVLFGSVSGVVYGAQSSFQDLDRRVRRTFVDKAKSVFVLPDGSVWDCQLEMACRKAFKGDDLADFQDSNRRKKKKKLTDEQVALFTLEYARSLNRVSGIVRTVDFAEPRLTHRIAAPDDGVERRLIYIGAEDEIVVQQENEDGGLIVSMGSGGVTRYVGLDASSSKYRKGGQLEGPFLLVWEQWNRSKGRTYRNSSLIEGLIVGLEEASVDAEGLFDLVQERALSLGDWQWSFERVTDGRRLVWSRKRVYP